MADDERWHYLTEETVQVGQPPNHESRTADLCEPCVRRALAEFEAVRRG